MTLKVETLDYNKANTYQIKIRGYQGTYSGLAQEVLFNVDVIDACPTAVISTTSVADKTYFFYDPQLSIDIPLFTSTVSAVACGAWTYTAT